MLLLMLTVIWKLRIQTHTLQIPGAPALKEQGHLGGAGVHSRTSHELQQKSSNTPNPGVGGGHTDTQDGLNARHLEFCKA